MLPPDLIDVFITPLEQIDIEYMITGSVASTIFGEPRLTHDIDIVLLLKVMDIKRFIDRFPSSNFYCPPAEVIRIELNRKNRAHFNLIHHETGYKADCYPYTGDPLHSWAFNKVKRVQMRPDLTINVAPPEYVILRKLQYFREGGSDKHISDIKKMILSSECNPDYDTIKFWINELHLEKEWKILDVKKD